MAAERELNHRSKSKLEDYQSDEMPFPPEIPERFYDGDDADEDCTALSVTNTYMNQSVFGIITTVGPQLDFNARFHAQSSDEEENEGSQQIIEAKENLMSTGGQSEMQENLKEKLSQPSLLHSVSELHLKPKSPPLSKLDQNKQTFVEPPNVALDPPSQAPIWHAMVMSRMFEAKAEMPVSPGNEPFDNETSNTQIDEKRKEIQMRSNLSRKLMEIFHLETVEEVIAEYPCWLMNSVLLQGYMYITIKHICFFAHLPRKSNEVIKSGYLYKSGRRNPKFHQYWFRLKGDVLSYYTDPQDLYFLRGNINLRYGICAKIINKNNLKEAVYFNVITHQREYNFKAGSATSANEWVKAIQKIIFRSHNEGDSVKISLPIDNVMDIEESQIINFADTYKIRVVDNGDTYAVDEYFFSFFSFGKEALSLLRKVVKDSTARQFSKETLVVNLNERFISENRAVLSKRSSSCLSSGLKSKPISPISTSNVPFLEEKVRATLSPTFSPTFSKTSRESTEINRTCADLSPKIFDLRGSDMNKSENSNAYNLQPTSINLNDVIELNHADERSFKTKNLLDSFDRSIIEPLSLNSSQSATDDVIDTHATGSQILKGSGVFFSPTIKHTSTALVAPDKQASCLSNQHPIELPLQNSSEILTDSSADFQNEPPTSTPALQCIVKAGTYPLQRAAGFAGYINRHSKRVSNLLATESIGYVEKVSGMWKGGKKHYDGAHFIDSDHLYESTENEDFIGSAGRFRDHFSLPEAEILQAAYFGFLIRVLPLYGKIYISNRSFCFRSILPGTNTKLILPLTDIENVDKEKGFRFGYSGLVVVIKAHEELFFEFSHVDTRDDCAVTLLQNLETFRNLRDSGDLTFEEKEYADSAAAEHFELQQAHFRNHDHDGFHHSEDRKPQLSPIAFDDPRASILNFKPAESMRITCLTIGSRGDVQPYIALCKGLIAEGHYPRIATHLEFKEWIEGYEIEFKPVAGDPAELMRISIENGLFTYSFLKEASSKLRGWVNELLSSAWSACQGSDLLIESPSAMGGIHIAEALEIPYFRAFTMPWTRTRAYPHAFAVPECKMGGAYNYITYVMFDNIFWKAISGQINLWRKKELGLRSTNLEKMQPNKVPFLYNFSPAVVVPPLDFSDWIRVTGYWFLDEGTDWIPPVELTDFVARARKDGKKLVYVGFGSIVVHDSAALMTTIIKSVEKAGVRCILSRGWSDRLDNKEIRKVEPNLPPSLIQIRSVPHDWLFKHIDAVAHHGGAGTTGASLRAGLPTIIKPFFGDQYFFGSRVEDLGVGITLKKLNVSVFSRALWQACNDERMIIKARNLGKIIRKEDGVSIAIQAIYRDLDYAKSLIKRRNGKAIDDAHEDLERSWTFIGEESEPEVVRRHHVHNSRNRSSTNNSGNVSLNESDYHSSNDNSI